MDIDLRKLETRHAHDLMTSALIPRPIAWVSTISPEGKTNLAPFSFFSGISWSPPLLSFSPVNRSDGTKKDTVRNIELIPEFVIHIVSTDLLQVMEQSAGAVPYGEDENTINGIHLVPSQAVKPFRIAEARVSFECSLAQIVRLTDGPDAGNLIIGRVVLMHADDDIVKNGREIDWLGLDALGRLSGNRYCTTRQVIESESH